MIERHEGRISQTYQWRQLNSVNGEVSEWPKEHDWKSCVRVTVPRVQIPPSPPEPRSFLENFEAFFLQCRL